MRFTDLSPPPIEAVTLSGAKTFLRVDHDYEDELIEGFSRLARERIEQHICMSIVSRRQRFERFCPRGKVFYLNRFPISDIEAVRVVTPKQTFTLTESAYIANIKARPCPITLTSGQDWLAAFPDAQLIEIDFTAGYGETLDDIPMALRQAVLLLIGQSYEQRGEQDAGFPLMVDSLLMPYKGLRL